MQRATFMITVIAGVISFVATTLQAQSQETLLPMPLPDEAGADAELPAPSDAPRVERPLRDYSHAYLGVTFDPRVRNAAVARSVTAGSPADQAGVRAGDTIVSLNGAATPTYDDVLKTVAMLKAGDVLDIEISRRVSVRARAVLDGQPLDDSHTSLYRPRVDPLPTPMAIQPAEVGPRVPRDNDSLRERGNSVTQQRRNNGLNRNNTNRNDNDRGRERFRGRSPRRR